MADEAGPARHRKVELAGACNMRDLGGLPAAGGRTTRFGVVYRADALSRLGRHSDAQAALAEYHYRQGDLMSAIQQLRLAARDPGNDYYKASKIEARLEEMERERAQQTRRR